MTNRNREKREKKKEKKQEGRAIPFRHGGGTYKEVGEKRVAERGKEKK